MKLMVQLQNGRRVEAPVEQWVAALVATMDPEAKARLCDAVEKKNVAYSTPGHHVLRAESGVIGLGKG